MQNETIRDGGNLTWEKLVEEAKHQEHVGKEYAKFRRENSGSGTPSYGDPALAADAISRGYKKPQQRSWTPSGGKGGGNSQKQCDRCGKRNGCTGKKGTCPAWGRECGFCNGKNHYRAVCWKAAQGQKGGGTQPKHQKQGKGKSPGKTGKAKAKHTHSVVFKMVPSVKGIVSRSEERASVSNSVTSKPSVPLSKAARRGNLVLSGNIQSKASLHSHNVFSCDSIHNTGDDTLNQRQTDIDPSGRLCILVDLHVRARTNSRTHNIRVKADPGADANLMLIHHFRQIFPCLCDSSGNPKVGVLEKAESSFESYSGENVTVIGQTKIYTKNKQTQQFMIMRIFVTARERGPILLGNACQWLGLIAVLVENKARVVGRFMAVVTREETEGGEVEAYPIPKTGDGAEMTESRPQSQKAITAPKKKRIRTKKAKLVAPAPEPLDIILESAHSECQSSAPERTEPYSSQEQNTVLSGSVPHAELGPNRKVTGKKRAKDGPIRKADSTEIP